MILVECRPDQTLLRNLLDVPKREIVHAQNKPQLLARLSKITNTMAMVDEDPLANQPAYLTKLQVIKDIPGSGLKILEDTSKRNRVILLRPKLEDWLITAARDGGVSLSDSRYNLPITPNRLHREINFDLRKLERLIADLKSTRWFNSLSECFNC